MAELFLLGLGAIKVICSAVQDSKDRERRYRLARNEQNVRNAANARGQRLNMKIHRMIISTNGVYKEEKFDIDFETEEAMMEFLRDDMESQTRALMACCLNNQRAITRH